eukprot:1337958-Pyramimonas_sp.AAC.1
MDDDARSTRREFIPVERLGSYRRWGLSTSNRRCASFPLLRKDDSEGAGGALLCGCRGKRSAQTHSRRVPNGTTAANSGRDTGSAATSSSPRWVVSIPPV